jgi:hypothetical protein
VPPLATRRRYAPGVRGPSLGRAAKGKRSRGGGARRRKRRGSLKRRLAASNSDFEFANLDTAWGEGWRRWLGGGEVGLDFTTKVAVLAVAVGASEAKVAESLNAETLCKDSVKEAYYGRLPPPPSFAPVLLVRTGAPALIVRPR